MHQILLHIDWFLSVSLSFSASAVFYRSEETTGSGLESHSQLLPAARGGNQHWSVVRAQTQTTAKIQTQPGLPPLAISLSLSVSLSLHSLPCSFCPSLSPMAMAAFLKGVEKLPHLLKRSLWPKVCKSVVTEDCTGPWMLAIGCDCVCVCLTFTNSGEGHISLLPLML